MESPNLYCVRHVHAFPRPPVRCLKHASSHPPFSALTMRILTNSAWQVLSPFLLSYFTPRIPDKNSSRRRQSSGSILLYSSAGDGTRGPGCVNRSFTEPCPPDRLLSTRAGVCSLLLANTLFFDKHIERPPEPDLRRQEQNNCSKQSSGFYLLKTLSATAPSTPSGTKPAALVTGVLCQVI